MRDFLELNKRGKFEIIPSPGNRSKIKQLATARKLPRQPSYQVDAVVENALTLSPLVDAGSMAASPHATASLGRLKRAYTLSRIAIKKAEYRYKRNNKYHKKIPLQTPPFQHQRRAFGFSTVLDASALFMEQGTGKTYVSLGVASQRYLWGQVKKVLVVCPKSVVPVWPSQMRKHLSIDYHWDKVPKNNQARIRSSFGSGLNFLVVNYDKLKSRMKAIEKWKPDMAILDESHRIKKGTNDRSKACHKLGDLVNYKLILTGTPLGQTIEDIWSQYRFLNPDQFSRSFKIFKSNYCIIEEFYNRQSNIFYDKIVDYKNLEIFTKKLHELAFRCTKKECLDLPQEIEQPRYCEPDKETLRIYRELELEKYVEIEDSEVEVQRAISEIIKLRQITGGKVKDAEGKLLHVGKVKLNTLEEIIEDKDWNSKLVVFVSFTHEIKLVKNLLRSHSHKALVLSGKTRERDRDSIEKTFTEDPDFDSMIVQVDTGGEGLDFTAASDAVFYSPTFSFIKVSQAKARLHRLGQLRSVNYIYILMEGTIDEIVFKYLEKYGELSSTILDKSRDYQLNQEKSYERRTGKGSRRSRKRA